MSAIRVLEALRPGAVEGVEHIDGDELAVAGAVLDLNPADGAGAAPQDFRLEGPAPLALLRVVGHVDQVNAHAGDLVEEVLIHSHEKASSGRTP